MKNFKGTFAFRGRPEKNNNLLNKKSIIGVILILIAFFGCTGMFMAG